MIASKKEQKGTEVLILEDYHKKHIYPHPHYGRMGGPGFDLLKMGMGQVFESFAKSEQQVRVDAGESNQNQNQTQTQEREVNEEVRASNGMRATA